MKVVLAIVLFAGVTFAARIESSSDILRLAKAFSSLLNNPSGNHFRSSGSAITDPRIGVVSQLDLLDNLFRSSCTSESNPTACNRDDGSGVTCIGCGSGVDCCTESWVAPWAQSLGAPFGPCTPQCQPQPSAPIPEGASDAETIPCETETVEAHNARRVIAPQANPVLTNVTFNQALATAAANYAAKCIWAHETPSNGMGENLAASISTGRTVATCAHAVHGINQWDDEKQFYDISTNTCLSGKVCGHHTQLVWSSSIEIGCATALCPKNTLGASFSDKPDNIWKHEKSSFTVCKYSPPGNYVGQSPYTI